MDPRIAARRSRVQEQKARGSMSRLLWLLAFVLAGGLIAWLLLRAPLFQISEIELVGVERSDPQEELTVAGIIVGQPMILADLSAAEDALATDPWIAAVDLRRMWPDRIVVEFGEREPVAIVECSGATVLADGTGIVLPSPDAATFDLGRIKTPNLPCESLSSDLGARMALEFLAELPERVARSSTLFSSPEGWEATVAGYLVRLGAAEHGAEKARALEAVLVDPPETGSVITLVAPTRPAVLPPSASTNAPTTTVP